MFRPNKVIKSIAFIVSVLAISLSLSYLVSAWTEPSANPPTPNVSTPLNIGATGQSKQGGLILNTGGAANGLIVQNGNVGIGVPIPGTKLDISGDVRWTGTLQGGAMPWARLTGKPAGLDDGDQVGITSESDPTVPASVKDGISWGEVSGRPAGLDDGDQVGITSESDPTVTASVKDGVSWGEVSGRPSYSCGAANQGLKTIDLNSGAVSCETDDIGGGGVTGSGTANYISKWTGGTSLGNSVIYDNGNVGIGTTSPSQKLDVAGYVKGQSGLCIGGDCRTAWPAGGISSCTTAVSSVNDYSFTGTWMGRSGIFQGNHATCSSGYYLTGGGCSIAAYNGSIMDSHPSGSWYCGFFLDSGSLTRAWAVCCK